MWIKAKGGELKNGLALVNMDKVFSVEVIGNKVIAYGGEVSINDNEDVERSEVTLAEFHFNESAEMYLEVLGRMLNAADVEKKYAERLDADEVLKIFKSLKGANAELAEDMVYEQILGKKQPRNAYPAAALEADPELVEKLRNQKLAENTKAV